MTASNFPFIKNNVLRQNLDEAFDHVVTLLPFTESDVYNDAAKSAFRKTIIIYSASIVEALLFHVLDAKFTNEDIAEHYSSWQLGDKTILHEVSSSHKVVSGHYKKVKGDGNKAKMNLGQINGFLKDKKVITKTLFDKVDIMRELRNEQHIGTQKKVKSYSKDDLEEAFSVAHDVKEFARRNE